MDEINQLNNRVISWFEDDEQVQHYNQEMMNEVILPVEKWILDIVTTKPADILDIGCGTGRISTYLARRGHKVTGIDVSSRLIELARKHAAHLSLDINYELVENDLCNFRAQRRFDHIVAFKVYCYLPAASREIFLQKTWDLLKPGGTLILTQHIVPEENICDAKDSFYNTEAWKYSILEEGDTFPLGKGYVHWFTVKQLENEMMNSGFSIIVNDDDKRFGGQGWYKLFVLQKISTISRGDNHDC